MSVRLQAFQDGVELEDAHMLSGDEHDSMKDIKKGVTLTCTEYYKLAGKSDVEVECSELLSLDSDTITKHIALNKTPPGAANAGAVITRERDMSRRCIYARCKRGIPEGRDLLPLLWEKASTGAQQEAAHSGSGTRSVYKLSGDRKRPYYAVLGGVSTGRMYATRQEAESALELMLSTSRPDLFSYTAGRLLRCLVRCRLSRYGSQFSTRV